jgi:nitrite reductase/ring-hydroxylating ferredoxin subunit/uncharacterized membrane protein
MRLQSLTTNVAAAVERSQQLDRLADPLNRLVSRAVPSGGLRDVLAGTWLGHPVHPFVVSMPIGCWTGASVLDALKQRGAARALIGAGVLSVVPTALAGLSDWVDTSGAERRVGLVHVLANTAATSAYSASWLARRAHRDRVGVALAVAGAALASAGGWLGGHMSYALGVGIDTNSFDAGPIPWTTLDVDVAADGTRARASVGPTGLLVTRQPDGVRVLAERCSHRGAPLSGGTLADGCVTCPWHGSRFDLTSGHVRRGPAVVAQPTYQVREHGGALQIRREEPRALRANTTHPE